MAQVQMELTVTWKGAKPATLDYLFDGGVVVPLAGQQTTGTGEIRVRYLADDTGVHKIEWGLVFPGEKLGGLQATARIRDGEVQTLAAPDDEQHHKWIGAGVAVG